MGLHPNIILMLEALGPCGVLLPLEQKAVLAHSLPLKEAKAGLSQLTLWGRISTRNGKDYLVAVGLAKLAPGQPPKSAVKYCFSQDAVKWIDLEGLSEETAAKAATIAGALSGEPAKAYTVATPGAPPPAEGEVISKRLTPLKVLQRFYRLLSPCEASEEAPPGQSISELQRLRSIVDRISMDTTVVPVDSIKMDASGGTKFNQLFQGVPYPDKLESYIHGLAGQDGPSLATDVQGTWSLQHDPFKGYTTIRSLIWPGYHFYFSSANSTWGALYSGDGARNNDLVFML